MLYSQGQSHRLEIVPHDDTAVRGGSRLYELSCYIPRVSHIALRLCPMMTRLCVEAAGCMSYHVIFPAGSVTSP